MSSAVDTTMHQEGALAAGWDQDKAKFVPVEDERSSISSGDDTQAGVKRIEVVSQTWTTWSLVFAYVG